MHSTTETVLDTRVRATSEPVTPDGRPVLIWLAVIFFMIFLMVAIGGITRLTGSGLSIVDWKPLMGAIPPLNEAEWLEVFDRYKQSPQYIQVNHWMTLGDFKKIFFWEYFHRLFGRLIGLVVLVPGIYFLVRGRMTQTTAWRSFAAFVFGGLQGVLGWYMVKSGLVSIPSVSHFRLAAHLVLAFFVAQWILWMMLDLGERRRGPAVEVANVRPMRIAIWGFIALISVQIIYGAFMAGTKAGWLYPTFPKMGNEWIPSALWQIDTSIWDTLVNHVIVIHFVHRALAYVCLATGLYLAARLLRPHWPRPVRVRSAFLAGALVVQFLIGVLTVLLQVPISMAVAHQVGAFVLLSAAVAVAHGLRAGKA